MHHIHPLSAQLPYTPAAAPLATVSPPRPSKATFLSIFGSLYDSLPDARITQEHIDDMLENAAANIGREVESERERRAEWEKRMDERLSDFSANASSELILLEKRIAELEKRGSSVATNSTNVSMHESQVDAGGPVQVLLRRIEQLEEANARSSVSPRVTSKTGSAVNDQEQE